MSTAREELHESMCGSCCGRFARGECEAVDRSIDAYAHELAEQQRAEVQGSDDPVYCQSSCGWLIDLIDPEVTT